MQLAVRDPGDPWRISMNDQTRRPSRDHGCDLERPTRLRDDFTTRWLDPPPTRGPLNQRSPVSRSSRPSRPHGSAGKGGRAGNATSSVVALAPTRLSSVPSASSSWRYSSDSCHPSRNPFSRSRRRIDGSASAAYMVSPASMLLRTSCEESIAQPPVCQRPSSPGRLRL